MDGRHQRRDRSRHAVLSACQQGVADTGVLPSMDAVAVGAGVSRRTVFRLFRDQETLLVAALRGQTADVALQLPSLPPREAPLTARISAVVHHRSEVYEHTGPLRRVAAGYAGGAQLAAHFAAEHASRVRALQGPFGGLYPMQLQAVVLLTSWASYDALRRDQGCTVDMARRVLEISLKRLLQ